jgi:hypothetical protein
MQTDIQKIYSQNILPLSESEQLKLASLILERVVRSDGGKSRSSSHSVRELFGSFSLGRPTGLDNETIDRDLGLAYSDEHEDQN